MNSRDRALADYERLDVLERQLAGALRPVAPPRALLTRLRSRIHFPDRSEIADRLRDWQTLTIALVSVLSGALAIITVARALFHMVGRRNVG